MLSRGRTFDALCKSVNESDIDFLLESRMRLMSSPLKEASGPDIL